MRRSNRVSIEKMQMKHLEQVYEIEVDSFSIPWSKKDIENEIANNQLAFYIVAKDGETVMGYGGMWHVVTEGHITNIAVKSEYRQRGIGRMILDALIQIALEREMIGLTLEVRMNNAPAMRLYASRGFKPEGIRKNYYTDTKEDAVIMWKYLP